MTARRSAQRLYLVYLARVIKIEAVQCHREAVTDDDRTQSLFFIAGCRPKLTGHFQWSLDAPEEDFPGAPPGAPFALVLNPISLPLQLAWDAAVAAFKEFIKAIINGEWIASGSHPATGVRHDLDPAELTREGLILDVRNGDLIEVDEVQSSWVELAFSKKTVRWTAITLREAESVGAADPVRSAEPSRTAAPVRKLGRIDWDDWWTYEIGRRQKDLLPNKKGYLGEAEVRIEDRYGVTTVPPTELRRMKAALYRGDSERPKRPKRRKQSKLKG